MNKTSAVGAVAIVSAIAAFIMPFEGMKTKAYPDPAKPEIATICYGETHGVNFGDVSTPGECRERLLKRIPEYLAPVDRLLPNLPDNRRIAYADAAYNMGEGIITRRKKDGMHREITGTSIADLERVGNWQAACRRLLVFDYAGGKRMAGLTNRRQAEYKMCIGG